MVLTNSTDAQTIYRATNLGANDFLIKSEWSLDAITQKVRERLSNI
jgi:DNA-binding NarL/FixJ family response regulator